MKRWVFDVLRRGVENTLANWPLLLLRLGEIIVFGILAVLTAIAALLPILVSVGIEISKIATTADIENAVLALTTKWVLLIWAFVAVSVLVLMFLAMHGFVEAGSARVYIDGERAAGPLMEGSRSRFHVFSMERWLAGAKRGWWTVFWIYNFAWSVAGLILLIPLLPTLAGVLLLREQQAAAIMTGCVGVVFTGLVMVIVGAITGIWVNRAINEWAVRDTGALESLAIAWRAMRADLGRHLLIFVAMFVIAMVGSSFFSTLSLFAGMGDAFGGQHGVVNLFTFPLRIFGTMLNAAFSTMVSAWYLACFATLTNDEVKQG